MLSEKLCFHGSALDPHLQFLMIFGKRVLQIDAGSDPYARKYKGIWICFMILARALGGNYVMCGVFELYGDPCLKVLPLQGQP